MSALHSFACSSDNYCPRNSSEDHFLCGLQSMSARPVTGKCAAGDTHECNAVQVHEMTGNHLSGGPLTENSLGLSRNCRIPTAVGSYGSVHVSHMYWYDGTLRRYTLQNTVQNS